MYLLGLLILPLVIGVVALLLGKGLLTLKELLVQEGCLILAIGAFYGSALLITRHGAASDTEIRNGSVASKQEITTGCCHSYPCNPYPCNCNSKGSCSICYQTCYKHSHDIKWIADSTNNERVYVDGCNAPGTPIPKRWQQIVIGEPTAVEYGYTNYIKANPNSILRRTGAAQKFGNLIPKYPEVFDYYRSDEFLFIQVPVSASTKQDANMHLRKLNAALGAKKQLNLVIVVVKTSDLQYVEALRESWLGGKKNDVVVVIGAQDFPVLSFVSVMSWSKSEEMKLAIRDRVMELKTFDSDKILSIIADEVGRKFVRREMKEYEYLMASVEPPTWALILILIAGLAASIFSTWFFLTHDPFGSDRRK